MRCLRLLMVLAATAYCGDSLLAQTPAASVVDLTCMKTASTDRAFDQSVGIVFANGPADGVWLVDRARGRIYRLGNDAVIKDTIQLSLDPVGPGPRFGEIAMIDGKFWVQDYRRHELIQFDSEGRIGSVPVPQTVPWRDSLGTSIRVAEMLKEGYFLGRPAVLTPILQSGLVVSLPFLKLGPTGTVVDTLLWVPAAPHHAAIEPVR